MSDETTTTPTTNTETPSAQAAQSLPREARMAALRSRVAREDDETPAAEETTPQPAAEGTETESADAAPTAEGDAEAGASTADSDADKDGKGKDEAAAKAEADKKADPKLAPKFAALAREKSEVLKLKTEQAQAARLFDEQKKQHAEHVAKVSADLEKRETTIRAREEEINREILAHPEKFVRWLGAELGIDSIEKFAEYAKGKWQKPTEPKAEDKPFTKAEADKYIADKLAEAEKKAEEHRAIQKSVESFEQGFAEKDEKGSLKYRAACLVFSKADRIREGDKIGKALKESGKTYASHDEFLSDVREAVNALAERDDRWQEIRKLGAAQVSGANGTSTAAKPAATPVADTAARQSRPGQNQPSKDEKKPTPPAAALNGSSPQGDFKAARKARLQRLMHG